VSRHIGASNHRHHEHADKEADNYDNNCGTYIIQISPLNVAILNKYMKIATFINNTTIEEHIYSKHTINNIIINSVFQTVVSVYGLNVSAGLVN
jgi:hypothetical protein